MARKYKWMHDWLEELAEVRAAERRTRHRLRKGHKVRKKGSKAVDILRLVQQLREGPMSIPRIMADYGVSRRTVYNWIDTIEKADVRLTRTPNVDGMQLRVAS